MEESKAPEDIYPQLTVNELRQCVYLFTKYIPCLLYTSDAADE